MREAMLWHFSGWCRQARSLWRSPCGHENTFGTHLGHKENGNDKIKTGHAMAELRIMLRAPPCPKCNVLDGIYVECDCRGLEMIGLEAAVGRRNDFFWGETVSFAAETDGALCRSCLLRFTDDTAAVGGLFDLGHFGKK